MKYLADARNDVRFAVNPTCLQAHIITKKKPYVKT